jgi:hypothetical protein
MPDRIATLFPVMLIIEDVIAAGLYAWAGKWIHAGYWFSAAVLTTFVTLMKG